MDTTVSTVIKQISEALSRDPRTQQSVIDVAYNQGVVILTGTVKSREMLRAAEEIAQSQPGVVSVVNELRIA
jgi:osmotically-inducible protein OsmY